MNKYDVIILGLGGMGSAVARACANLGRSVLGLEQFSPVHDFGSSHGKSRVIRQAYFESPRYIPLLFRAYDLWRELELESGRSLLWITGGLFMGPPHLDVFSGSLAGARLHDLPHEVLDAREIGKRWPVFSPAPHFLGLYEERAGVLPVEKCVRAMLDVAEDRGADLRFQQQVLGWEANDNGVVVATAEGTFEGGALVLCPGPWASTQIHYSLPLTVERMVLHWYRPLCDIGVFHPKRFPVYFCQVDEMADFYGFPIIDGGGAKVAFHTFREPCDPDTIRREISDAEIHRMSHYLKTFLPDLAGEHLHASTCMYTSTPDGHFVLGPHPQHRRVTLACGFSGHGYKFAPLIGEVASQLALEGGTSHDIGLFDPTRFEKGSGIEPDPKL